MRTSRNSVSALGANDLDAHVDWCETRLSTFSEMAEAIEAIVIALAEVGYSPQDLLGARLALEEAICNAIKHGHEGDQSKVVEVRTCIRADHFLVEVEDEGPGFDPAQVPDATAAENLDRPCGRGLLLIRHYAAWVRHNEAGNCVAFCMYSSRRLPIDLPLAPFPIES